MTAPVERPAHDGAGSVLAARTGVAGDLEVPRPLRLLLTASPQPGPGRPHMTPASRGPRRSGRAALLTAAELMRKKASVFEIASIREWRGQDVVDAEGHKIGELEAVYVDTSTDLPSFGTVQVGMPTRHRLVFVPLNRATVGPGYLKVAYDRKQVKDAPSIGTDGELPAGDEEAIFKHYGLAYQPGANGERLLARR